MELRKRLVLAVIVGGGFVLTFSFARRGELKALMAGARSGNDQDRRTLIRMTVRTLAFGLFLAIFSFSPFLEL
jgi:hypothetical protein